MQEFSLIDIFYLPYGAYLAKLGYNFLEDPATRPNVARYVHSKLCGSISFVLMQGMSRWWKDITSRPSWQAVKERIEI